MEKMPKISVSWGEVFDKITILEIKLEKILDESKRENIKKELDEIMKVAGSMNDFPTQIQNLISELKTVNSKLWEIEDNIRTCEKNKQFDATFIALARSVYINNDKRYFIKKQINELLNSPIKEEKSYSDY